MSCKHQPLARRLHQTVGVLADLRKRRVGDANAVVQRHEVFLLARQQVGAVDLQQRITALDDVTRRSREHVLDPALNLRVDVVHPRVVVRDARRGAHDARHGRFDHSHRRGADQVAFPVGQDDRVASGDRRPRRGFGHGRVGHQGHAADRQDPAWSETT
jgi:hypothetical protein